MITSSQAPGQAPAEEAAIALGWAPSSGLSRDAQGVCKGCTAPGDSAPGQDGSGALRARRSRSAAGGQGEAVDAESVGRF
jgi:hypothetical protein